MIELRSDIAVTKQRKDIAVGGAKSLRLLFLVVCKDVVDHAVEHIFGWQFLDLLVPLRHDILPKRRILNAHPALAFPWDDIVAHLHSLLSDPLLYDSHWDWSVLLSNCRT